MALKSDARLFSRADYNALLKWAAAYAKREYDIDAPWLPTGGSCEAASSSMPAAREASHTAATDEVVVDGGHVGWEGPLDSRDEWSEQEDADPEPPHQTSAKAAGKRKAPPAVSPYFAAASAAIQPPSDNDDCGAVPDGDAPPMMLSGVRDFYERQQARRRKRR